MESQLRIEVALLRWLLDGIRHMPDAKSIVEYVEGMKHRREVELFREEEAEREREDREIDSKLGWRTNAD